MEKCLCYFMSALSIAFADIVLEMLVMGAGMPMLYHRDAPMFMISQECVIGECHE